ncbi:MAG: MFS transporter, partial [Candidatus Hodarchaeota archaeon]
MNEKTSEELSFKPRMPGNDPNRLNLLRTFFLSLAFLSVLVTLTYYNFAVPLLLFEMIPDDFSIFFGIFRENSLVGTIMTIDNMLAVILQPYFAALSDRTRSKFGRRMPFIIIGVLVCAFTFAIAPWIKILLGFVLILFFFNLFMSFYRSSALVLLADYTPEKVRSAGSGLQQFIANFGTIIAFLVMPISGLIIPQVQE